MKDGDIKGDPLESISIGLSKRSVVGGMKNRGDEQARRDPRLDRENILSRKLNRAQVRAPNVQLAQDECQ